MKKIYWVVLLLPLILAGLALIYTLLNPPEKKPVAVSEPTKKTVAPQGTIAAPPMQLIYFKDGLVFKINAAGESVKLFDLAAEEGLASLSGVHWQVSPDKSKLAYLGLSGGLDSAIKIIDLQTGKKLAQTVFGSAQVASFAWSPDGKKVLLAVTEKKTEESYSTNFYLVDSVTGESVEIIKGENIRVTQILWPGPNSFYYLRYSYAGPTNGQWALVSVAWPSLKRVPYLITRYKSERFSFVLNESKTKAFFYSWPNYTPEADPYNAVFDWPLDNASIKRVKLTHFSAIGEALWSGNKIILIHNQLGSPDSSIEIYDPETDSNYSLLDMGPSGGFNSVLLSRSGSLDLLVVDSVFDDQNGISVFDLKDLSSKRKNGQNPSALWQTEGSSPVF